jgi:outer membrane murein-binding lipoprotein Lpp
MNRSERSGSRAGRIQLLALAAVFLVATIVQVALAGGPEAGKSASVKKQINQLKARIAALESKPDQVGQTPTIPPTPTTLPPSGPAGGELAGNYPSPTIGTVAGLDLASSTGTDAGINFGTDVDLFRSAANTLALGGNDRFNASQVGVSNGLFSNTLLLEETTGVIIPFANTAYFHAVDVAGKTQVRITWPGGATTTLATEP